MNCNSKNVIYLIECNCCGIQYIGETKLSLRARANQHLRDIVNCNSTPVGSHFNDRGSLGNRTLCDIDDFCIFPIIQCPTLDTIEKTTNNRKEIENFLINKLKTYMPYGLNKRVIGAKDIPIIPFVVPYSKYSISASKIAQKHYDILQDKFPSLYTSRFVSAYSANKSLKNHLVSSKFEPIEFNE